MDARRSLLVRLLLGLAWVPCAHAALPLAPDIWLVRGEFVPGRQPDGNSVLLRGPEGLIVVDSGRHAAHAQAILDAAAAAGMPVAVIINTHWHLDHVSGNPGLRKAHPGLRVLASDAIDEALKGFLARSRQQLEQMLAQPGDAAQRQAMQDEIARIDAGPALRPDEIVSTGGARRLAGREIVLGLEADAVSGGDIWVFDPATRVLIAGDLVTLPAPFLDTACPARWRAALGRLDAVAFETLVPGHGAPMTRAQFDVWRRAFDRLLDCAGGGGELKESADAAICVDGWLADAAPLLGDAPVSQTRGLVDYYVQQRLRGAGAKSDCPAE